MKLSEVKIICNFQEAAMIAAVSVQRVSEYADVRSFGEEMPVGRCSCDTFYIIEIKCIYNNTNFMHPQPFDIEIKTGDKTRVYKDCVYVSVNEQALPGDDIMQCARIKALRRI